MATKQWLQAECSITVEGFLDGNFVEWNSECTTTKTSYSEYNCSRSGSRGVVRVSQPPLPKPYQGSRKNNVVV